MKKIIAAFDGLKYSESTRDYAIYLAKQTNTHLVGVFLDDPIYTSYKIYDLVVKQGATEDKLRKFEAKDKATRDAAAENFEKACQQSGIEYTVHHDRKTAIQALKHESIYADLLVIDSKETLTHYTEKLPTRFIRDLLGDAQCPVLMVSQKYKPIQKIILLYDGEPSSVHAIKMFSYLLPQLKHLDTEIISVNPVNATLHLPDNKLMKEFMKRHYPKAKYTVMKGWAEDEIIKHLKQAQENSLVVLGAYRRGTVSRWFRESMADILMKEVKLPLFIAHNK
jgi:nucleotide-binding universal stress UspA family protein